MALFVKTSSLKSMVSIAFSKVYAAKIAYDYAPTPDHYYVLLAVYKKLQRQLRRLQAVDRYFLDNALTGRIPGYNDIRLDLYNELLELSPANITLPFVKDLYNV